jgi:hypothetical protein
MALTKMGVGILTEVEEKRRGVVYHPYRLKELTPLSAVLSAVAVSVVCWYRKSGAKSGVERHGYSSSQINTDIDQLNKDSCNFTYKISTMNTPSSQCRCQSHNTTKSDKETSQRIQFSKFPQ